MPLKICSTCHGCIWLSNVSIISISRTRTGEEESIYGPGVILYYHPTVTTIWDTEAMPLNGPTISGDIKKTQGMQTKLYLSPEAPLESSLSAPLTIGSP